MVQQYQLQAEVRKERKKNVDALRQAGKVPGVMYGHKVDPVAIQVDYSTLEKTLREAGESSLIDLSVGEGKPVKVLIHDYQLDPMTSKIKHVDFYQVNMTEKITTEIPLEFIGEAPAVKELSGTLVTSIDSVEVQCLPGDLVHSIEVDISTLKTFEDAIHISDIKAPQGIEILNDPEETIATVQEPRSEEELQALDEKPEQTLPEGAEETKPAEGYEKTDSADNKEA